MKIAISMKSNFSYERLLTTIYNNETLQKIEIYKDNIQTISDLDDVTDIWKPDLIVLDKKAPLIVQMEMVCKNKNVPIIYFDSDYDQLIDEIAKFFSIEEEESDLEQTKREIKYIKDEPVERVVYKDRIVEKVVVKTSYRSVPNKLIVVGSLWNGAGATTLSINLARALAERGINVAYVEYPLHKPYMFDYLSIPMKEEKRREQYTDFAKEIEKNGVVKNKSLVWNEDSIDWYVLDTRNEPIQSFVYEDLLKLVYSINSSITILDISANFHHPEVQKFLHHVDEIFVCVEPDIVKMDWISTVFDNGKEAKIQRAEKKALDFLTTLEEKEGISYQFVNMKYTQNIDNKTFLEMFSNKKPIAFIPYIPYETYIQFVWESKFIYDDLDYRDIMDKKLKPIITRLVPRQFYELESKKKKGLKSFMNLLMKQKGEEEHEES